MFRLLTPLAVLAACMAAEAQQAPLFNVGRAPTADEVKAWDISVGPSGNELPAGQGTAKLGAPIYAQKCAACHGAKGEGVTAPALAGGQGTLTTDQPKKTVGSYWPYATTIFDYIRRAMPRGQPQSLPPNDVYSLTALMLYWNDIIKEDDVLDADKLRSIKMPNRETFYPELDVLLEQRCRTGTCR